MTPVPDYTIKPAGGLILKATLEVRDRADALTGVWRRWDPSHARWGLRMADFTGELPEDPSLVLRPRMFGAGSARIDMERPDGLPSGQFVLSRLSGPYAERWTLSDAMGAPVATLTPAGGTLARALGMCGLFVLAPGLAPDLVLRVTGGKRPVARLRVVSKTVSIRFIEPTEQLALEEILAFGCVLLRNVL